MAEASGSRTRVAVLISGGGSNMAALLEASRAPGSDYEVVLVLSNRPEAPGLARAAAEGVATAAVDHRAFAGGREAHERQVDEVLRRHQVEVVALAGYMRLLTPWLVQRWTGRMTNIHPSLLPKYPGLDTHARALAEGDAEAGCTVHLVDEGLDEGEILAQARVLVLAGDTPESLAERVLKAEHELYPRALGALCRTLRQAV